MYALVSMMSKMFKEAMPDVDDLSAMLIIPVAPSRKDERSAEDRPSNKQESFRQAREYNGKVTVCPLYQSIPDWYGNPEMLEVIPLKEAVNYPNSAHAVAQLRGREVVRLTIGGVTADCFQRHDPSRPMWRVYGVWTESFDLAVAYRVATGWNPQPGAAVRDRNAVEVAARQRVK